MILTDYFKPKKDISWDYAKQCGVNHGVIGLPEENEFDITKEADWKSLIQNFNNFGLTPIMIEPLPEWLHYHIKTGDDKRDDSVERLIKAFPIMARLGISTICFNFMAHIGWCRTDKAIEERGGAFVTGFDLEKFEAPVVSITEEQLWENYEYFLRKVLPFAETYGIKLALHPDDPPLAKLGSVSRIMTSYENIKKAMSIVPSENLGITMCQACYCLMGEDVEKVVRELKDKIFFIHFRNVKGDKTCFRETFHDNGVLPMGKILRLYKELGINVPIRVDHVPLMAGEAEGTDGYTFLGRLYAIGYLKGLLENAG